MESAGLFAGTLWFQLYRRGGRVILHHGHIRPVLIRAWSPEIYGITATIRGPAGPPCPSGPMTA